MKLDLKDRWAALPIGAKFLLIAAVVAALLVVAWQTGGAP